MGISFLCQFYGKFYTPASIQRFIQSIIPKVHFCKLFFFSFLHPSFIIFDNNLNFLWHQHIKSDGIYIQAKKRVCAASEWMILVAAQEHNKHMMLMLLLLLVLICLWRSCGWRWWCCWWIKMMVIKSPCNFSFQTNVCTKNLSLSWYSVYVVVKCMHACVCISTDKGIHKWECVLVCVSVISVVVIGLICEKKVLMHFYDLTIRL